LSFGGLEKARLFYFFDCFTKSLVVFSDDSPTPFPPLLPSIYLSPPPLWRLSAELKSSCTYSSPVSSFPLNSDSKPQLSRKLPPKMVLQVYDARGSFPSSSSFVILFFFSSVTLFRCTECGGHGTVRYSFLFLPRFITITHIPFNLGLLLLPPTYYLYLSTLTPRCSMDGAAVHTILHSRSYSIYLALWVCMAPCGHHRGDSASGRKGFASTDSQSYIYLIAVFLLLALFLSVILIF
jgi:hypothetical protein